MRAPDAPMLGSLRRACRHLPARALATAAAEPPAAPLALPKSALLAHLRAPRPRRRLVVLSLQALVDQGLLRSGADYTLALSALARLRDGADAPRALALLAAMREQARDGGGGVAPNVVHFNAALHACWRAGAATEALALLADMEAGAPPGPAPDEQTYRCVIGACENADGRWHDAAPARRALYRLQVGDPREIDVNRRTSRVG